MPAPDDLALLVEATRAGAETAMRYWRTKPEAWDKGDGQGPVSVADIAVDAALSDVLRSARPTYGWLSEETEDDVARLSSDCVFIVDPIDGTRSYLDGQETWAISVALWCRGAVEAAVVALPAKQRLYAATAGGGAERDGAPIRPSGRTVVADARVLAPRRALSAEVWRDRDPPNVARHFRPSLAYRMCLVAEGRFDAMMSFQPCWEWDIAAGALIAAEAGATVTDGAGAPLVFNSAAARTPGAVVATPDLHAALLAPAGAV